MRVYAQWEDGWDLTVEKTDATSQVLSTDHNKLVSTIQRAADDSDMAEGRINRSGKLPAGTEGYIKCKFKPVTLSLVDNSSPIIVKAGANSLLDFYLDSLLNGNIFCAAGVLAVGSPNPSAGFTFSAGNTYVLEFWWKQNQALVMNINGANKINMTGLAGSTLSGITTEVRGGIDHYDGVSTAGWSNEISELQIGDSFTDSFADPAVPTITIPPVISGPIAVGSEIDSSTGTWSSPLPILGYSYIWRRDAVAIPGALSNSYLTSADDVGHAINDSVTAANSWGSSDPSASNSLGPILGVAQDPPPPPTVTGLGTSFGDALYDTVKHLELDD